jgi:hypothetical protein
MSHLTIKVARREPADCRTRQAVRPGYSISKMHDKSERCGESDDCERRLVHPSGIEGLIILARGPRYSARGFPA